ncbi:MAG: tRNA 5-methoxyuridine(34)/uridine 5-oxyacetic acid(34) synthase CmoB [Gammaproteobacteria bacterium]
MSAETDIGAALEHLLLSRYAPLLTFLRQHSNPSLQLWAEQLPEQIAHGLDPQRFGDLPAWLETLAQLPTAQPQQIDFSANAPCIGNADELDEPTRAAIQSALWALSPWRKGPFSVFGTHIDAEWQSDRKWARLAPHLNLQNQLVLDVGCGNGYYALRMLGMGAARVIGIDPSPRFVVQFAALRHFLDAETPIAADVLPLKSEELPANLAAFDTTFSMGVLYHRREPVQHLRELWSALRPGGTLILETMILQDDADGLLIPAERYAQMRNVWGIPGLNVLMNWVGEARFIDATILDVTRTTPEEQRRTAWMTYHSLSDFLDPSDPNKTIEGYPAPVRVILRAHKPS